MISRHTKRSIPYIIFTNPNLKSIDTRQDDLMVIAIEVANCEIRKTLVDQGSSVHVLYWKTFKTMGLDKDSIIPLDEQIVGFSGEFVDTRGYVDLYTKFGRID